MFQNFDGLIRIDEFTCLEEQFRVIEPAFSGLPAWAKSRRYNPNATGGRPKHILVTSDDAQRAGPNPWPEGDTILANANRYPRAFDAAFPPHDGNVQSAPEDAPLHPEDTERLSRSLGVTQAQIGKAKKNRGKSMP